MSEFGTYEEAADAGSFDPYPDCAELHEGPEPAEEAESENEATAPGLVPPPALAVPRHLPFEPCDCEIPPDRQGKPWHCAAAGPELPDGRPPAGEPAADGSRASFVTLSRGLARLELSERQYGLIGTALSLYVERLILRGAAPADVRDRVTEIRQARALGDRLRRLGAVDHPVTVGSVGD